MNKLFLYLSTLTVFAVTHPKIFMTSVGIASATTAGAQYIVVQLGNGDTIHATVIGAGQLWKFDSSILTQQIKDSMATKLCSRDARNSTTYDKTGLVAPVAKIFTDTFSVSSATPTISLSTYLTAMSASSFKVISCSGFRSGATASNSPNVCVTAISSNSVTLALNQTNTATTTILGISVLSGLPIVAVPDPTAVKVVLSFYAW